MMDQPKQMEAPTSANWYRIWQTSYATVGSRFPLLSEMDIEDCASGGTLDSFIRATPGFEQNHAIRKAMCLAWDECRRVARRRQHQARPSGLSVSGASRGTCASIEAGILLGQVLREVYPSYVRRLLAHFLEGAPLNKAALCRFRKRLPAMVAGEHRRARRRKRPARAQ